MFIKTVTEKELKDYMINMIVNNDQSDYFIIIHKKQDQYDIYSDVNKFIKGNCYKLCINRDYWFEQFEQYVNESTRQYAQGVKGYGEKRTLKLIDKTLEDKEQFRDFMYLANDHLEYDPSFMEIVF